MPVLENLLLSVAAVVGLAGIAVYEAAADWHLPGFARAAIPPVVAVIILALLWKRGRVRASAPADPPMELSASRSRAWAGNLALAAADLALSPYWLHWVRSSPVPLRARIVGSFFGVAAVLMMGARVWTRRRNPFRPALPIVLAGALVVAGTLAFDACLLTEGAALNRVTRLMSVANQVRVNRGATRDSLEEYLADLRRIDLGHCPDEFQSAYHDYVRALAGQLIWADLNDRAGGDGDIVKANHAQAAMVAAVARFQ
jgi:hypothetical protein